MKKVLLSLFVVSALFQSCSNDDDGNVETKVTAPSTYEFTREGNSTVSYSGQTTRIKMADEVVTALKVETNTEATIDAMFAHVENANDFSDADLNASDKSVRSKVAASTDYFSANTTEANEIKADFDTWIEEQVNDVFPSWSVTAEVGVAGALQQAGGGTVRYINAKGLEYNQAFAKGLIGGLMIDQIVNNYLSSAVLDAGTNVEDNNNAVLEEGKSYTTMEHKWDEAFGYLYGAEADATNPVLDVDQFLSEYLDRVEADEDFAGIASTIYDAFKLGRAAIVAGEYDVRDAQAEIIKGNISVIPAVRAVYYLQSGKNKLGVDDASAFHALSEAYGFIYSLQFTRKPNTTLPYLTKTEVDAYLAQLMEGNGFWDVTADTLDTMSDEISEAFGFTTEAAAN
ncbi:DUF4856 domain-containing protein [Algibacter amylolyticus]|uniref:DUF4856 domain-containing protein n=1 Tax=Algibacter amylolyticus TaxID=1608400 RepID=A0A5M7B176_9FLAO|nr:DUF4856 domain-containing protein [Algibacter amylolyticus]KAA5821978.1 DUF4856 domain-containing protein [Algibacter amylolyticus]MBB5269220.1 hypothetical protein [Algibacter amylolyticus]TSJ73262.1 DUF4856 domain-containing protein [Algibacter amylolyticus]